MRFATHLVHVALPFNSAISDNGLLFQQTVHALFFIPFVIFLGLSWNNLVPNWRMESPYYIHHIT